MYVWNSNWLNCELERASQLEAIIMKAFSEQVRTIAVLKNGFIVAGSLLLHSCVETGQEGAGLSSCPGGQTGKGDCQSFLLYSSKLEKQPSI